MQRAIGFRPITACYGVHFHMMEPHKIQSYRITGEALSALAGRTLTTHELETVFVSHRNAIEATAVHKFRGTDVLIEHRTIDAQDIIVRLAAALQEKSYLRNSGDPVGVDAQRGGGTNSRQFSAPTR